MDRSNVKMGLTVLLTGIALAIGGVFYLLYGGFIFTVYAITVPFCLYLLWLSRDVESWEERWAPAPRERPAAAMEPAARRPAARRPAASHA
jgi:hypothetical protein